MDKDNLIKIIGREEFSKSTLYYRLLQKTTFVKIKNMKLTKFFWIPFFLILLLWSWVTISTWGAPHSDGSRIFGFPLTIYSYGGLCSDGDSFGICKGPLLFENLILDILFLLLVPYLIHFVFKNWLKK